MLILGLLLLAGAGVFTGLVIADNTSGGPDYNVSVLGHSIATMNSLEIFCAGLALALIFCLGTAMAMAGGVSRRHRSRKLTEARRSAAENARERDALAARLDTMNEQETAPAAREGHAPDGAYDPDGTSGYGADTGRAADDDRPPERVGATRHRHARHLFGH
ncbi:hypothetical protein ABZ901_29490 [Actinacidiphila alni]|uniref:hypothetical protein n=1 Tax=Actinacidiphila alni TaxID=380248 RepID=UPI0033C5C272